MTMNAKSIMPRPVPPPVIRPIDIRADEKPVSVETDGGTTVEDNGLYRRVKTTFTFTNPNSRPMSADFEFPIPAEATVCGYALEINGTMVPGVVCGKEKARVAFESEKAKRVDPGIVEHVKGNVWKTRIFPLRPKTPRKAEVEYIVPEKKRRRRRCTSATEHTSSTRTTLSPRARARRALSSSS